MIKLLATNIATLALCGLAFVTYTYQVEGHGFSPWITGPAGFVLWTLLVIYLTTGEPADD
jgi:hypothetical protein